MRAPSVEQYNSAPESCPNIQKYRNRGFGSVFFWLITRGRLAQLGYTPDIWRRGLCRWEPCLTLFITSAFQTQEPYKKRETWFDLPMLALSVGTEKPAGDYIAHTRQKRAGRCLVEWG